MSHLLVPLDGAKAAETVFPMIRRLDAFGLSEITLLKTELPVAMDGYAVVCEAVLEQARSYLAEARNQLSGLKTPVRTLARLGPATSTILEVVDEKKATLVLMALDRRPRLVRFLFGSEAERLVRRCPVPVLVVPSPSAELAPTGPQEGRPLRSILVPLDGGRASRTILPHALELAQVGGARLLLVSVVPSHHPERTDFELAEEQLYAAGADCAAAGIDFSVLVESGDPVGRILAVCRDRGVDCIAMSTRGRSSLSRWIAPSATLRVLRESWLPTLTIRSDPAVRPVGLGAPHALGRQ